MDISKIAEFISKALLLNHGGAKEFVLTSNLSAYLRSMFPEDPLWVEHYFNGIEDGVTLYKTKTSGASSGSIDVYVNGTVIEFERDLSSKSIYTHGLGQVKDYCAAKIRAGVPIEKLIGVLSDTLTWEFYTVDPISGLAPSSYTSSSIKLILVDRIQLTSSDHTSALTLGKAFEEYFGRKEARQLSAKNLYDDFGLETSLGNQYLTDCQSFIATLSSIKPHYYSMIQNLWESFVEGLDRSITGSVDSYTIEFYIASLAKLLCANLFEGRALLSDDNELIDLLSGEYFLRKGYVNFIEYDYFGWINGHIKGSSFLTSLHSLQEALAIYDFSSIPDSDIFGKLLSQLSSKTKRILLGQELTPTWLAKEVVNAVYKGLPQGSLPRFIDMCCGSGSMIISTIKLCSSLICDSTLKDDERYSIIADCALGIDIDPLAVLLAKINWIIHTKEFCSCKSEIIIPIYHADSLFISSPVTSGASSLTLSFDGNTVDLPKYLLDYKNNEFFSILIERLASAINLSSLDSELLISSIATETRASFSPAELIEIQSFADSLHSILYNLHTSGKNGIWAFLLKNSFKPALISRKFNGIVSNTPWMTLSQVNNNPYRDSLNSISKKYHIFPGDSSSPHSEIATVFLLHSIDTFLEDNAPFGCILPRSVMNGQQHDKFRLDKTMPGFVPFRISPRQLWDLPSDTFNNRAIALFGNKNVGHVSPSFFICRSYLTPSVYTMSRVYKVMLGNRTFWTIKTQSIKQLYDNYSFEEGCDILPRTFFYFDLRLYGKNYEISQLIKTSSSYGYFLTDAKEPYKSYIPSTARIPKALFKRTIVSNVVLPFIITDYPLALIPYTKDPATLRWRRLSPTELAALPRPVSSTLDKLSSDYALNDSKSRELYSDTVFNYRQKVYKQSFTSGKFLVVGGAGGSNIAAAYVKLDSTNQDIIVDQTLYYYQVDTEEEAIYLVGLLNSNVLNEAIKAFQTSGLFGERHIHSLPYRFIPQYDPSTKSHSDLVDATKLLIGEINTLLSSGSVSSLLDPNTSPLRSRRPAFFSEIEKLSSFKKYNLCCREVIK